MRKIVRLNDPTSHGGKVTSVSANQFTVGGIPVARIGDAVTCPIHGAGTIIEGDAHHVIDGIGVAFEGHKVSCGAILQSTVNNFGRL